nr:pentatricopeptide repeat protein AaPPR480 [Agave angustifolia]
MHGRNLLQFSKRAPPISTINSKVQSHNPQKSLNTSHEHFRFQQQFQNFDEDLSSRFISLLKNCQGPSDLHKGRQIHAQIIANGLNNNSYLDTRVLGMYILCRGFSDAKDVFFRVDRRSSAPWNWMIRGFAVVGWFEFALLFYFKMWVFGVLPDNYIYPYVIKSCCGLSAFTLGRMIHGTIRSLGLEKDLKVGSSLIHMYAQDGRIGEARGV